MTCVRPASFQRLHEVEEWEKWGERGGARVPSGKNSATRPEDRVVNLLDISNSKTQGVSSLGGRNADTHLDPTRAHLKSNAPHR